MKPKNKENAMIIGYTPYVIHSKYGLKSSNVTFPLLQDFALLRFHKQFEHLYPKKLVLKR